MIFRFASFLLLASTLALCPAWADSGDLYKPVDTSELASNPQKYWAIGIVFKDTLVTAPARESIRVGNKTYVKFSTQLAGDCYAGAEALASPPHLAPEQDYLFTGTVLQRSSGRGWFSSGGVKYIIAVQKIVPAMKSVGKLEDMLKLLSASADSADLLTMQRMNEMFAGMQSDVAATAENRKVEMWEMFVSGSSNRLEAQSIVSGGLSSMATQTKLTPEDLLAQFVISLLAGRYPPPEDAVTIAEPTDEMAPMPEVPKVEVKKAEAPKAKKKNKAPDPVINEAPPTLKPRLRATPMEVHIPAEPVTAKEEIAVEMPKAPAPAIESAAPAPEPPPTNAPTLPKATPEHMEQTMDQLDPAQPMPAPAPPVENVEPAPPAAQLPENSNTPVPL